MAFDHGAQYFTVRHPEFETVVADWVMDGLVAEWKARLVVVDRVGGPMRTASDLPRYVGVPGMNVLGKTLAQGLDVRQEVTVTGLERHGAAWRLRVGDGVAPDEFEAVAVTAPPLQTAALLGEAHPLTAQVLGATLQPCWALMVAFATPVDVRWQGAFVNDGPLSWIAHDGSKPGRADADTWVLHASAQWSTLHLEHDKDEVVSLLMQAFTDIAGAPLPPVTLVDAHRWRYALVTQALDERSLWDADTRVGVAGDYCRGPRVEGAWLSGRDLALRMLATS